MPGQSQPSSRHRPVVVAAIVGVLGVGSVAVLLPMLFLIGLGAASSAADDPSEEALREIPEVVLDAYLQAALDVEDVRSECTGLSWTVLAGIGKVESGHATGAAIITDAGLVSPPILGPVLDGTGAGGNTDPVYDTDDGKWDGHREYDRAVGPMQFLPATWESLGQDGNRDGQKSPHNVYDAALAAAVHVCGDGPSDMTDLETLRQGIYSYNQSWAYVDEVLAWADVYGAVGGTPPPGPFDPPPGGGPGPWGGHENGRIPASALCPQDWDRPELLRCDATSGLAELNTAFKARFGTSLPVLDSYRTYAQQVALKEYWCSIGACHMAATPGHSNHGWGLAVDFSGPIAMFGTTEHEWMQRHAPDYGWHHPAWAKPGRGKEEPWHWEWGQAP